MNCPDCGTNKYIIEKDIGNIPTIFCSKCLTVISYEKIKYKKNKKEKEKKYYSSKQRS